MPIESNAVLIRGSTLVLKEPFVELRLPKKTRFVMEIEAPFSTHKGRVLPEWVDYNGHMAVTYYILAFDQATDAFLEYLGIDENYRLETGGSTFAVEAHVTYRREVNEGDPLRFTTQLLGFDEKRIRFFHHMNHGSEGYLAATTEWLSLHVNLSTRRVSPMPELLLRRLQSIYSAHRALDLPECAGRGVRDVVPKGW